MLPLPPEFIAPQDWAEKQDCKRNAAKRWLVRHGPAMAHLRPIYLDDDLFACQPIAAAIQQTGGNFILTCKPSSHQTITDWRYEGPGYRDAGAYLSGAQVQGNGELLAMILGCDPHPALGQVAQSVMPNGFAAFVPKPDIPTYLVGQPEEIADFHKLIPAPNETYCHLFWPFDTTRIDALLKARHAARKVARAQPKGGR